MGGQSFGQSNKVIALSQAIDNSNIIMSSLTPQERCHFAAKHHEEGLSRGTGLAELDLERCDVQFERCDAFDYQMVIVQGGNTRASLHTFLIDMSTVITRTLATVGKQI